MKKLLTLVIVFSLALILNNVSFAQEIAPAQDTVEGTIVQGTTNYCGPVLPYRGCPFVRRACTPYIANPCNPCPPYQPEPICAPAPRRLCGAPIQPPCFAAQQPPCFGAHQAVSPCGDSGYEDYGCGYDRHPRLRGFFSRLFSKFHRADPYYGYDGFSGCQCGQQQQIEVQAEQK